MRLLFREYTFIYWLSKVLVRLGFILFSRTSIINERKVPREGGVLLVSNHISHLDPPVIGTTCSRKVFFLAKKELFRGFLGWYMRNAGQIAVDRGKGHAAVDVAVETLQSGRCICIFPEGTRSRTGEMQKPRTGVVVIASKSNVPIVPILVEGTFEMMPPKTKFPRLFRKVRITYGDPFYLTESEKDLGNKEIMRKTADMIMDRIKALGKTGTRETPKND